VVVLQRGKFMSDLESEDLQEYFCFLSARSQPACVPVRQESERKLVVELAAI
jgi:hypothetical protein